MNLKYRKRKITFLKRYIQYIKENVIEIFASFMKGKEL